MTRNPFRKLKNSLFEYEGLFTQKYLLTSSNITLSPLLQPLSLTHSLLHKDSNLRKPEHLGRATTGAAPQLFAERVRRPVQGVFVFHGDGPTGSATPLSGK